MKRLPILFCLLIFPLLSYADDGSDNSDNRLFHIERSKNRNIVCYDANLNNDALDKSHPMDVYWINHEEKDGKKSGLTSIQRKMAFGYKVVSKGIDSACIAINACPDREIKINKSGEKYQCIVDINDEIAVLKKIFVKTKDNNSLKVEYVELTGVDLNSGKMINEKIYN